MDTNTKNLGERTTKISFQLKTIFRLFNPFLLLGVIFQCVVFWKYGESWISLVSGILGVIGVVWVSQRRLAAYIPCFIQLGTYLWLAIEQKLWGKVGENIFYLITMLFGIFLWARKSTTGGFVIARKLKKKTFLYIIIGMIIATIGLWFVLSLSNDTQPELDAITTIPAIIAQILMINRYREQWIFWFIIDVFSIWMWWNAGDMCMIVQYIWWTANCLYGYKLWGK